jgi:Fe-S-cluster containining protein
MFYSVQEYQKKTNDFSKFICLGCTNCCKSTIVAVTHYDLIRLARYSSTCPLNISKLYAPNEILCSHDDAMWIHFPQGKRMIGLRKNKDSTCLFLNKNSDCSVYSSRPQSCRAFPLSINDSCRNNKEKVMFRDSIKEHGLKCRGIFNSSKNPPKSISQLEKEKAEKMAYINLVNRWNTERLGKTKIEFFQYLGLIITT